MTDDNSPSGHTYTTDPGGSIFFPDCYRVRRCTGHIIWLFDVPFLLMIGIGWVIYAATGVPERRVTFSVDVCGRVSRR